MPMPKVLNFGYKGADRSVYRMKIEYEGDPSVKSVAGIDLSHLTAAEQAEFKQEIARHDAAMQKFIRTAYRRFLVKDMEDPSEEDW